jgi:hypothetical protein
MVLDPNADVHFSKSPSSAVPDHKELVMNTSTLKQAAIVRIWGGRTRATAPTSTKKFFIELPKEVQVLRLLKNHGVTGSATRRSARS